jgi:hypothetical protein
VARGHFIDHANGVRADEAVEISIRSARWRSWHRWTTPAGVLTGFRSMTPTGTYVPTPACHGLLLPCTTRTWTSVPFHMRKP